MTLSNIVAMSLVSEIFAFDTTEIAPVKLFAAVLSIIALVSAVKLVVPLTVSAPVCEMIPFVATFRLPVIADVPNSRALTSTSETFLPNTTETAPVKSFAAFLRVISFSPTVEVAGSPLCEAAAFKTIAELPSEPSTVSVVDVISFSLAVKLVAPLTISTPLPSTPSPGAT